MTQIEFNQQHPTGEQLTMIHYDFKTGERTAQPAVVMGTKQNPKYPDDHRYGLTHGEIQRESDRNTRL
jgi:hypothetical protein